MKSIGAKGFSDIPASSVILSEEALNFIALLTREFRTTRKHLLARRQYRQEKFLAGELPSISDATQRIRQDNWKICPVPRDLEDRRVEITGPSADTKMAINAFNSGANVYMADFEDSQTPTRLNLVNGQLNMYKAVRGFLKWQSPEGKPYRLNQKRAVLFVRPRGWHMTEKSILVDDRPAPASLVDFGLFLFHNARILIEQGSGPYFYLPKLESHLEARLWNDVFCLAQDLLKIKHGTIKATVLIETLPAVFEMDEILYELREHSAGLNCGRWDYIFSFIKKLGHNPEFTLPDRSQLTMDTPFLSAYSKLLVETCHRRGAHALGGMAAQIPIKNNPAANTLAMAKVEADKIREASHDVGHDGTWVAHPGLVATAKRVFDRYMPRPNQLHLRHHDTKQLVKQLLDIPAGDITENGLRINTRVTLEYMESWLNGNGCVPINNLMEDAATAEISRVQLWQWLKHNPKLADGRRVERTLFDKILSEELSILNARKNSKPFKYYSATKILLELLTPEKCPEFLTTAAYDEVVRKEESK